MEQFLQSIVLVNSTSQNDGDSGERAAEFVRLYTANARRVYTYILTLVPNRADAEDVFSELSTVLWEKFDQFELGTNFGAWASRIAHFKVLQFREARSRAPVAFSQLAVDAIEIEMATMDNSLDEEYQALAECFAELAEHERHLLERRYATGGSPRKIAAEDERPVKAIYKSLDRLRRKLFECITRKLSAGDPR